MSGHKEDFEAVIGELLGTGGAWFAFCVWFCVWVWVDGFCGGLIILLRALVWCILPVEIFWVGFVQILYMFLCTLSACFWRNEYLLWIFFCKCK